MLLMDQGNVTYEDLQFQPGYVVTRPMYGSGMKTCFVPEPDGVTSRKRSRNSVFLNEDVASQMFQQQLEIDHFVAQHAEKMRREINEMRKRSTRRMIMAANEGILKRLKTKEDELTRLNQINWSLEQKLESLLVENQIWRELAQTNEATANNLQQLLAQAQQQQQQTLVDDGDESCCGSSSSDYEEEDKVKKKQYMCVECGKKSSCVLVLPCRHLCLCHVCDSTTTICPVCSSTKSAGLLINMDT